MMSQAEESVLNRKLEDKDLRVLINRIVKLLNLKSLRDTWSDWFFKWLPSLLVWLNQIRFFALMILFDRVENISVYLGDFLVYFQSGRIELWILMAINLFQLNPSIAMILINLVPDMRARLLNVCNLFSLILASKMRKSLLHIIKNVN